MAEQRVVGGDHQVRVRALVEVPAVAVALGLDDADLLELLQRPVTGLHVRIPGADRRSVPERPLGRVSDLADALVFEPQLGEPQLGVVVALHELRKVGTAAEVVANAADHHDLDVVVDGGGTKQIGVSQPGRRRRGVQILGPVERDRRDLGLGVLFVEDQLFGFRPTVVVRHEHDSMTGWWSAPRARRP